jgi:hypothetical protein
MVQGYPFALVQAKWVVREQWYIAMEMGLAQK